MPDPIPRNRSAQNRRSRRLAMGWRGRAFRRTRDAVEEAQPPAQPQCTVVGPPIYLDQPLRRSRENAEPAPPLPAPPVASPPAPLLPVSPQPLAPLPAPPPPVSPPPVPPQPRLPVRPATRRDQPHRRARANPGQPRPPRPPWPRPTRTDLMIGGSLVAGIVLVMGLVLPLLPSGTSAGSTAIPAVRNHGGTAAAAPNGHGPDSVVDPPLPQPGVVGQVGHGPARDGVTLLADRSATRPDAPVANQPSPAQLPAPAQGASIANPGQRIDPIDPTAVNQGQQHTTPDHPDPDQHYPQPVPPGQPDTHPNPPPGPTREQLEQLAKQLAALQQNPGGIPKPPTSPDQGAPSGVIDPPASTASKPQVSSTPPGGKRSNNPSGNRTAPLNPDSSGGFLSPQSTSSSQGFSSSRSSSYSGSLSSSRSASSSRGSSSFSGGGGSRSSGGGSSSSRGSSGSSR